DPQLHVPGLRRQQSRSCTVAVGHPRVGALVSGGTDPLGRLQFDQLLQHDTDTVADQIGAITNTERLQQFRQGRLRQGHRQDSFSEYLAVHTDDPADGPQLTGATPTTSNPTTSRDSPALMTIIN